MGNQEEVTKKILRRHQTLAILRFLDRSPEYRTNEELLLGWLQHVALTCTRDHLRDIGLYLEREDLVRTEIVEGLMVFAATRKGCEVATGRRISEDIERPGPDCPY